MNALEVCDVAKSFGKTRALKGVTFAVPAGGFLTIVGPTNAGKSTLLNIIGILDNYDSGEYKLNETVMKNMSETKAAFYRNQYIGFVFQSFNLISFKNAVENVALPLYYQKVSRKKRNKLAMEYLERVGLKEWAEHTPNELSGGQKQRIAIARALIAKPKIILADEPSGNLDSAHARELHELFFKLRKEFNQTFVIVTHNEEHADMADRKLVMKDGVII